MKDIFSLVFAVKIKRSSNSVDCRLGS